MGKDYRQGRLGEEIKRIISDLLLRDLKDPGLSSMISVTAVDVTGDGSYATVYISALELNGEGNDEQAQQDAIQALRRAKGFIRTEIGRQIKLRHTPDLIFKVDTSMEYGRHISELIRELDISSEDEKDEEQ